jgi:hypothetical protein
MTVPASVVLTLQTDAEIVSPLSQWERAGVRGRRSRPYASRLLDVAIHHFFNSLFRPDLINQIVLLFPFPRTLRALSQALNLRRHQRRISSGTPGRLSRNSDFA